MTTALALVLTLLPATGELALGGLDPVELVGGHEVPGVAAHARTFGRFTYRFATSESAAAFDADPRRFEIQLGGACARMGPLSGLGSPERFAVYDGRIYVFASDECRAGFLASPERYLDRDDPLPEPSVESVREGRAVLERALEALGGAERVDSWKTLVAEQAGSGEGGGAPSLVRRMVVRLPDGFRSESHWQGGYQLAVSTPQGGFVDRSGEVNEMHPSEWVVHRKELFREPLVVLRARKLPGFLAVGASPAEAGGVRCERVTCAFEGATTTLWVSVPTGRVVRVTYKGRDGAGAIGYVQRDFSDFRPVSGVALPFHRSSTRDGEASSEVRWTSLALDAEVGPDAFRPPSSAGEGR